MKVTVFHCGPMANESERMAVEQLKTKLISLSGDGEWILLCNLSFSVTHQLQSEEIDIVAIGPPGVKVVEVKHWTAAWINKNRDVVEREADRVTLKAKKVGTTLRRVVKSLPRVDGAFLLTEGSAKISRVLGETVRGVPFHGLRDCEKAAGAGGMEVLTSDEVRRLGRALEPKCSVAIDGSLKRLAGYVNLELQTPKEERFHRVYKAVHAARQDRVVLHLYDLSASTERNADARAEREFEALRRLQLYPWAPRILDSYQEAPGYAGEMFFFSVVDPAAPTLEERSADETWSPESRVDFARRAVQALSDLHAADSDEPLVHRNLTPNTILVKYDNTPIFTGFERTKVPSQKTVASTTLPSNALVPYVPPEILSQGYACADQRSDVYALCASLGEIFKTLEDETSRRALSVLKQGLAEEPADRASLQELEAGLSQLLGDVHRVVPPPPARYWTEDQVIPFRGHEYRIVARLGSGGVGTTYKVVHVDSKTGEEFGTYVAKVAHEEHVGQRILRAYHLVRSHLGHTGLSTIFEVASEWQENSFVALMKWVDGAALSSFIGVFPLLAEEQGEPNAEALALRWLGQVCQALNVLHKNGIVHGDVSPKNLIVSGQDLVLTDYDFATRIGEPRASPGTVLYCPPPTPASQGAVASDELYALAASLFHVVFDREPFRYGGTLDKGRGLNWGEIDQGAYPVLSRWLNKATHPEPGDRFENAAEALKWLSEARVAGRTPMDGKAVTPPGVASEGDEALSEEQVEWLKGLLQSYPGSRWGNQETRGLDTEFAKSTYVATPLEETLLRDVRDRRVRLVILCGNAGDGKTALLQHLAMELGLGHHSSAQRVVEGEIPGGPTVRINFDGSAAWEGKTADQLLDAFLEPFQQGPPQEDIVHLLAINDGRLMEWIESYEERSGTTPLTEELYSLLQQEVATQESHIRFVDLNQRSLVGGVLPDKKAIATAFLERLVDHLYGGRDATEIWAPCRTCSAKRRCEVFRAARVFGPEGVPNRQPEPVRGRARERLFEALQAVHLRGETHITVRELRAALVYVLFGLHSCEDYHRRPAEETLPYWDRAFSPTSPARQGEVLGELARLDPGLEAHPRIDRYLVSNPAEQGDGPPRYPDLTVESARRRAFFEWSADHIQFVSGDPYALGLARGTHIGLFRDLPLSDAEDRMRVCERLCQGIAKLEQLPPRALDRKGVVPLRITPRTPTESAFWVEKPLGHFRVAADLPPEMEGMERLHRRAFLVYRYRDGREERLRMGAELFHLLLQLAEGYQLGDVSSDDTFAHLSIFVQRLVREDERRLLAWNPSQDERVYEVGVTLRETEGGVRQHLVIRPAGQEG